MNKLKVSISPSKEKNYDISFLNDFDFLEKNLKEQINGRNFLIVTDENVYKKTEFFKKQNLCDKNKILILPPGEKNKNLQNIEKIWDTCGKNYLDRSSVLINICGGVVGDMVGFAASSYKRGINFIQIPTTLLSMVDASVGGKTGFDNQYGKNIIGAFHQPEAVFCCIKFLETLEEVEIKNGLCEMIKHGILNSEAHFSDLENLANRNFNTLQSKEFLEILFLLVRDSITIKKEIVEQDEKEKGIRAHLNLGHTFGHAVELLSNYQIPHGQAVAIGCIMATEFSAKNNFCETNLIDRIESIFNKFNINLFCDFPEKEIWDKMKHDKKVFAGKIHLILPKKIGEVFIYEMK